jgi:predicted Fe-S protein YdhL (DUF1289 family)
VAVSPCVAVCRLDPASGRCVGCGRTIDEIAAWPGLDEERRLAIIERLKRDPPPSPRPR